MHQQGIRLKRFSNLVLLSFSYSNTILAVKLNRLRLVVLLEDSLYIHNIQDMKILHTIRDTPSNARGVCALSSNSDNAFLAYPGSPHSGEIQIFDVANLKAVSVVHAHNNPIVAMSFNREGTKLATASDKGTVIRVYSVPDGSRIYEFRRGMKRYANICSLAFDNDSRFLAASSNTETVHIFRLEDTSARNNVTNQEASNNPDSNTWMDYFNTVVSTSSNYLPTRVSDMLTQDRAFATVKLPFFGLKNICALTVIQKLLRVVVAAADGYLYVYNLDPEHGGECTLVRQHRLDGDHNANVEPTQPSYADAMKPAASDPVIQIQNRCSAKSDSNSSSSSDSSGIDAASDSPKGKLLNPISADELAKSLPLNDDNEFPPIDMFSD